MQWHDKSPQSGPASAFLKCWTRGGKQSKPSKPNCMNENQWGALRRHSVEQSPTERKQKPPKPCISMCPKLNLRSFLRILTPFLSSRCERTASLSASSAQAGAWQETLVCPLPSVTLRSASPGLLALPPQCLLNLTLLHLLCPYTSSLSCWKMLRWLWPATGRVSCHRSNNLPNPNRIV